MILSWEMKFCLLMEYDVQEIHSDNHIFGTTNKLNHKVLCCMLLHYVAILLLFQFFMHMRKFCLFIQVCSLVTVCELLCFLTNSFPYVLCITTITLKQLHCPGNPGSPVCPYIPFSPGYPLLPNDPLDPSIPGSPGSPAIP